MRRSFSSSALSWLLVLVVMTVGVMGQQSKAFAISAILTPFVITMTFKPRLTFFLPLLVLSQYGLQVSYVIMLSCFVYAVVHISQLRQRRILFPFVLYLFGAPFFVWYTFSRLSSFSYGGFNFASSFSSLGTYLSMAPFFWSALIPMVDEESGERMLNDLQLLSLVYVIPLIHLSFQDYFPFVRFCFWGAGFAFSYVIWSILDSSKIKWGRFILSGVACVFLILSFIRGGEGAVSFTQLAIAGFASTMLFVAYKMKRALVLFMPAMLLIVSCIYVLGSAKRAEDYQWYGSDRAYAEIKISDTASLLERLRAKAFGDRASVWAGSLDSIKRIWKENPVWIPPDADVMELNYSTARGMLRFTSDVAAHNVFLHCLRAFGFYGGSIMLLMYWILLGGKRYLIFINQERGSQFSLVAANCLAQGVIVGVTGQYTILLQFGFVIWGLLGLCYSRQCYLRGVL